MVKRLVKLGVSACVFAWDKIAGAGRRLTGKRPKAKAVVLYYHGVLLSERAGFERQMKLLRENAEVFDCARVELNGDRPWAAVTFDDGFISVVENALPALRENNIPTTIFVPSGYLGTAPGWVKRPELLQRKEVIVTPEELKTLANDPLVRIGSHTVTHPKLAAIGKEKVARELEDSKRTLEMIIGRPVDLFSFPHGSFNSDVLLLARNAGYKRVFGVKPALAFEDPAEFLTGRVAVDPSDWTLEFLLKVNGAYRWMA